MISELERVWREVPYFYTPSQHFPGIAKEGHEKNSVIAGCRTGMVHNLFLRSVVSPKLQQLNKITDILMRVD